MPNSSSSTRLLVLAAALGIVFTGYCPAIAPSFAKANKSSGRLESGVRKVDLCKAARKFVGADLRKNADVRSVSFPKSLGDYDVEGSAQGGYLVTSKYVCTRSKTAVTGTFTIRLQKDAHSHWEVLDIQFIE